MYADEVGFIALSRIEVELGNLTSAREWAELARKTQASDDPERTRLLSCLAMIEYAAGDHAAAQALIDEADADIKGHRGYFDYLVMTYRSRLARGSGQTEVAVAAVREAIARLLVEGRVVYLLDVLPEAVAVLRSVGRSSEADTLTAALLGWQETMDPGMLPTALAVLRRSAGDVAAASDWPQPEPAEAVRRLADQALSALS